VEEEDLRFLIQHTDLDESQVRMYYGQFLKKHPDGRLDRTSFREMMNICYPRADTGDIERHIFRMYDDNQDGFIDFREFMFVVYVMSSGSPEENLKQIFKLLDINNDGTISVSEFKRVVKDLYLLLESHQQIDKSIQDLLVEKAFIEMDINADGKVTSEEFIKACLSQKKFSTMLTLKLIKVFIE